MPGGWSRGGGRDRTGHVAAAGCRGQSSSPHDATPALVPVDGRRDLDPAMDSFSISPAPDVAVSAFLVASVLGAGVVEPLRAGLAVLIAFPLIVAVNRLGLRIEVGVGLLALAAVGWWAADAWSLATGTADDRRIVVDEVVGMLAGAAIAGRLALAPLALFSVAFLALDRFKPWPFSTLEVLPGAWGVLADDLVVAVALGLAVRLAGLAWRRVA
jgi:phosphatidylglycerophosphatase A